MATDPVTGHVVLFGGNFEVNNTNTNLNDTWTWDGVTWTQQTPATIPPASDEVFMATDPVHHDVLLVQRDFNQPPTTWTWDGSNWTQQSPATVPAVADSMADDPATGQVVLEAGGVTWTWDGTNWTEYPPSVTIPQGLANASMATDPATGHVLLFGGEVSVFTDATWTWDGTGWSMLRPATKIPASRVFSSLASDPNGRIVLFGGVGADVYGDTWSIAPSLTITPNSGPPGTPVSVHGFGYAPGATVMVVKYRTTQALPSGGPYTVICAAMVAVDSTFTCTGKIPKGAAAGALGPHDVVAKDSAGLKSRTQFLLT
jgi:hypothetical protein